MKKTIATFLCVLVVTICFTSCKTYYIPVDSFKQQFAGLQPSRQVTTRGPVGDRVTYSTYPIDTIQCVDKKGVVYHLANSPALEIRFAYGNNKRTIFYFDLMRINDSLITGGQSRFIGAIKKTIPLNTVTKIEIQDGGKNFRYVR